MDSLDGDTRQLTPWEPQPAPRAAVLEGEIVGETPEGQIRLLRETLEALVLAAPQTMNTAHDFAAAFAARILRGQFDGREAYQLSDQASALLGPSLPYTEEDLRRMLEILVDGGIRASIAIPLLTRLLRHVERFAAGQGLSESLRLPLERERDRLAPYTRATAFGRLRVRLDRLLTPQDAGVPMTTEPWSSVMRDDLSSMNARDAANWRALLAHAAQLDQTRASAKWLRTAAERVERIGFTAFREHVLSWLRAAAAPDERVLSEQNGAVLKGLAWLCANYDDAELARALAALAEALLRWLPTRLDWRGLKAGNACLNALGSMPGDESVAQLVRLSLRLKGKQLQTSVNRALETAVARSGMAREDVEELMVPTLDADAPADEVQRTLAAQRARMERLFFAERSWSLGVWRARYLDHPLLEQMTRSLLWQVEAPAAGARLGLPVGESFEDAHGLPLDDLPAETVVRLWHPLGAESPLIEAWRRRLRDLGVTQAFKQVDREVFTLGPEEWADAATARFVGQVLRQQQLNALCRERGWKYNVQGPWHGRPACAVCELPHWNLRAEFWMKAVPAAPEQLTSTAAYPYVVADLLRFRSLDGGICLLAEVSERVISEVVRDVALFVSVAVAKAASGLAGKTSSSRRRLAPPAE